MNIELTGSQLATAIAIGDYKLVGKLRRQLAVEFGRQRGWKFARLNDQSRGLAMLARRGMTPSGFDDRNEVNLPEGTWYKNANRELIAVMVQTFKPLVLNERLFSVVPLDYPKLRDASEGDDRLYLVQPTITSSCTGDQVFDYHYKYRRLFREGNTDKLTVKNMKVNYAIANAWYKTEDADFIEYMTVPLIMAALDQT